MITPLARNHKASAFRTNRGFTVTKTYFDLPDETEIAPLYKTRGDSADPLHAYLKLDHRDGTVSFGIGDNHPAVEAAEQHDGESEWKVPSALRGSYCPVLANGLQPLLQRVLDGCSGKNNGVLNNDAEAARREIDSLLGNDDGSGYGFARAFDASNPAHVAPVWDVAEWLPDGDNDITAATTDEELADWADEYESQAAEQGVHLVGSVLALLTAQRDGLRDLVETTA